MYYKKTVDSVTEVVTLTEAKAFLNISHSDDDTLISSLIKAARLWAENYIERSLFTQTWVLTMDKFPPNGKVIDLLKGPVASVTTLKYYDVDNSLQTWGSSNYVLDLNSIIARIEDVDGWPSTYDRINAVEVTYVAGETDATAIPNDIENAIKMKIADMYEVRQNVIIGNQVNIVGDGSRELLDHYKVYYAIKSY
jgi:uncharacterized phiE125 gp8 family phage protein